MTIVDTGRYRGQHQACSLSISPSQPFEESLLQTLAEASHSLAPTLDFLWLELTNRCNLQCTHCYSESSPYSGERDFLKADDYIRTIREGASLGCRKIQFIGGEPTLNASLPQLIAFASETGYEQIEVFTNLVRLNDTVLNSFQTHSVSVATSFYSYDPATHDQITSTRGSFDRTVANIRRIVSVGLPLRVAVIEMEQNANEYDRTVEFLQHLGVSQVSRDQVRGFGRAQKNPCAMGELCGQCATNILAVGPDGVVAPCIMSKQWPVGSLLTDNLANIAGSSLLAKTRAMIAEATALQAGFCQPECGPNRPLCPPQCGPSANCPPCGPNAGHKCQPNRNCGPGI